MPFHYCNASLIDPTTLILELDHIHDGQQGSTQGHMHNPDLTALWRPRPYIINDPFYSITADQTGLLREERHAVLNPGHGLTIAYFDSQISSDRACAHGFYYGLESVFEVVVELDHDGSRSRTLFRGSEAALQAFERDAFSWEANPQAFRPHSPHIVHG